MSITTDHTLRPVIEELRAAQQSPFPKLEWPEPGPDGGLVGVEPDALTRHLSSPQASALEARLYAGDRTAITDDALWEDPQPRITPLPIGMIEPPDDHADHALAALAEVEAAARALAASIAPRRPTLLQRLLPTTATAFWMACALWLGFLLARAEGWL